MATRLPPQLFDFQRQVVDFQRAAFDNSYRVMASLQEQQAQLFSRFVEQAPGVPAEAKEAVGEWIESYKRAREEFKSAVDKSFNLLDQYFDRVRGDDE